MLMQQSMKFGMFYTTNEVPTPVVKNSGLKKKGAGRRWKKSQERMNGRKINLQINWWGKKCEYDIVKC